MAKLFVKGHNGLFLLTASLIQPRVWFEVASLVNASSAAVKGWHPSS